MKTQKKARKENDSPTNGSTVLPMLPPCRICGEKASGFHYGVNTCEACKAFFRRNLDKGSTYRCIENGNCEILPGRRNSCAACRFNKCISLGMCKEAIKTGRYTHEKKAEDIKEVKRLEGGVVMEVESPKSSTQTSPNPVSSSVTKLTDEELQAIIDSIVNSYRSTSPYNPEFFEMLPEREQNFLEQRELRQEVFGPMKPLPRDEYAHILQTTGIDIDGRKEMFQAEIPHIEQSIRRFITFAKSIPGFSRTPVEDQISIIKNGKFEAWMIMTNGAFNPKHKLYATSSGRIVDFEEMTRFNDEDIVDSLFQIQARIRKLGLTQEEACILGALAVMLTDDCVIKEVAVVEQSQELLLQCLLYLFQKNGYSEMMHFAESVSCLTQLRTLKKYHFQAAENMMKEWVDKIEFPPLLFEMWSS